MIGSNLLTFFLTYLSTFFLIFLLTYLLKFFLTYLLKFFLIYLLIFFLIYFLTFFLIYLPIFFLTYLLTFFLTYLPTYFLIYFLTYLLTFFLTYRRQNTASTISLKNHSTNFIFTSDHTAKLISMTTLCLSNGNSIIIFDCIGPPRQKAVKSKDAKHLYFHIHTHHMHQTVPPKSKWNQEMQSWQWCHKYILWCVQTWSPTLATLILSPFLCLGTSFNSHSYIPTSQNDAEVRKLPKCERLRQTFPALTRPPYLEQTFLHMSHTTCFPPQPLAYKK